MNEYLRKMLGVAAITTTLLHGACAAQSLSEQPDSLLSLVAEEMGWVFVPEEQRPMLGTYWEVRSTYPIVGAPLPGPFAESRTPVYRLDAAGPGNHFLVDHTQRLASRDPAFLGQYGPLISELRTFVASLQGAPRDMSEEQSARADRQTSTAGTAGSLSVEPSYSDEALWLEIVCLTNGTGVFIVHPPLGEAGQMSYDLLMTTNLSLYSTGLNLTNWCWVGRSCPTQTPLLIPDLPEFVAYFRLARTNDTDGDGLTDAIESSVSHSDPSDPDQNGNEISDGWEWNHFGSFDQPPDGDYDNDQLTNLQEYQNGSNPNDIRFRVLAQSRSTNNPEVALQVELFGGRPSRMAVTTNMPFGAPKWGAYTGEPTVVLGPPDGRYDIWIALQARPFGSPTNWYSIAIDLDRAAPIIVVTNPIPGSTLSLPYIQIQGYADEPIIGLGFDVINSAGLKTYSTSLVTDQYFDVDLFSFTTNFFELVDVDLTNGVNTLIIRATDLAGNSTTNEFSYTLDLASDTEPPAFTIYWPEDGDTLSGTNFTLRGFTDDPTARVTVRVCAGDHSGAVPAVIERKGLVWAEDLPLLPGTNIVTVLAEDAAGNTSETEVRIVQSTVCLSMDPVPSERLHDLTVDVTGFVDTEGYTVWVNGVRASMSVDGSWEAQNVPLNEGNTAVIQARAIPNDDNGGQGSGGGAGGQPTYENPRNPASTRAVQNEGGKGRPSRRYLERHDEAWLYNRETHYDFYRNEAGVPGERFHWTEVKVFEEGGHTWIDGKGGTGFWSRVQVELAQGENPATNKCRGAVSFPAARYPEVRAGTWNLNEDCVEPRLPELTPCIPMESCDVTNHYDSETPLTLISNPGGPFDLQFVVIKHHSQSSRRAKSDVRVFTGDKDARRPSRPAILELRVPANEVTSGSPTCGLPGDQPMAASEFTIGEIGQPNADFTVYKPVTRGKTLNATVVAPQKRYVWGVEGDTHDLMIQCICDVPKEQERTTVGVGEYVDIKFDPQLSWHPPLWGHSGGGLNVGPNVHVHEVLYTASSNATSDNVMANFPTTGGKFVTLTTAFAVLEPQRVTASVRTLLRFTPPAVGAGMELDVVLQPPSVSFSRIEVMEPSEATIQISGYFTNHPPPSHDSEHGAGKWHPVGCNNVILGPPRDNFDTATSFGWPIGAEGSYTWPIHPIWRIPGTSIMKSLSGWSGQTHTLYPDGTVMVEKFDFGAIRGPYETSSRLRP